jgi:hypothetical protein
MIHVLCFKDRTNKINWHGCIATDVYGLIVVNFEIFSFLTVFIIKDLHTSVRLNTDKRENNRGHL